MKVNVKTSAKCQKILEIEVPKDVVNEEFERYFNELKKTAQVPGFRKGKVPRELLERRFADKANNKVLTNLVSDVYHKAIESENIQPIDLPAISNIDFKRGAKLSFQAKVDIRPDVHLRNYKNIKLKKQKLIVTEEEIKKILELLQERYAQFLPVETRAVALGDYIICDYNYAVNGKQIENKEKVWLAVKDEMFIPGLSKECEGMNAAEEKKFNLIVPKKFHDANIAGKTVQFHIRVREVKQKKLPELTDEFAKTIGKNSLDELKNLIKEDVTREKQMHVKQDIKAQLIDSLVKSMPIDVPSSLVDKRQKLLKETARSRLKQQGLDEEHIAEQEKKMGDFFEKEAIKQVRIFFILENIAQKENITVTGEEMEKRIEMIAQSYNQSKDEVLKYLSEKKLLENIHSELWEEKIVSFLTEHADIEEVSAK